MRDKPSGKAITGRRPSTCMLPTELGSPLVARESRAAEEERGHLDLLEAPRRERRLRAVMLWKLKRGRGVWRHRLCEEENVSGKKQ